MNARIYDPMFLSMRHFSLHRGMLAARSDFRITSKEISSMDLLNRDLSVVFHHANYGSPQCNEAATGNLLVRFRWILVIYRTMYRDRESRILITFRLNCQIRCLFETC